MLTQQQLERFHEKEPDYAEWTKFYLREGQVWAVSGVSKTIVTVEYRELMPDTIVTFDSGETISGKALLLTDDCRLLDIMI